MRSSHKQKPIWEDGGQKRPPDSPLHGEAAGHEATSDLGSNSLVLKMVAKRSENREEPMEEIGEVRESLTKGLDGLRKEFRSELKDARFEHGGDTALV
ncbi:hypothetical protein L484_005050 [Morus notabilis]|uniref:Uncharacterized protein n=1 Tax=Morus notabilis TaxID=981085 RepID=W9QJ23_9ROSA|nr:hypothetical protein L484_005050 [Morus notabilis]